MYNESHILIDEFYNKNKDKYNLTKSQIHDIVRTPFKLLNMVIEDLNNDIPVRIMNLGTFRRSKRRVGHLIGIHKKNISNPNGNPESQKISREQLPLLEDTYSRLPDYEKKV